MQRLHSHRSGRTNPHLFAALCALLLLPIGICRAATDPARNPDWAEPIDKTLNLYRVAPTLYRSAQFDKAHVAELKSLGIRTSVDLREFHSDSGALKGSSIEQVRIRTNTWRISDKNRNRSPCRDSSSRGQWTSSAALPPRSGSHRPRHRDVPHHLPGLDKRRSAR
jgi:hypothetical protein